jgi:hypothetical protein
MKVVRTVLIGAVLGFLAGIFLADMVGVVGVLAFGEATGWKPVPIVTAAIGAAFAGWRTARKNRPGARR